MSDTLSNALSRNSIPAPVVMNPLAAYSNALQVAHGVWANRSIQAQQLAGQAMTDAIGPDGTFDPAKANQNLAAAGPDAALAAQEMIKNSQALRGEQILQGDKAR